MAERRFSGDDLLRGSGNVFRDLGCADPDEEQAKAILAAEIIKALDSARLPTLVLVSPSPTSYKSARPSLSASLPNSWIP